MKDGPIITIDIPGTDSFTGTCIMQPTGELRWIEEKDPNNPAMEAICDTSVIPYQRRILQQHWSSIDGQHSEWRNVEFVSNPEVDQ